MDNKLFQNDNVTANSLIGFEFGGVFKEEDDIVIDKLRSILNREIMFSNVEYNLIEPTDANVIYSKDGNQSIIRTALYNYFEAIFVLPKLIQFLGTALKEFKGSYLYFKLGFNKDFCDVNQVNVMKFVLNFNEKFVLGKLNDITKDGEFEKMTDIKPLSIASCAELVQKQIHGMKYLDDNDSIYGIGFSSLKLGYVTFKYAQDINYRNKWEDIMKCVNHTIITLYNSTIHTEFDEAETKKIEELNKKFNDLATAFGCYELFHEKFKQVKLTVDLDTDKSRIDVIFPSIKDQLFNIVVCNEIKNVEINYDTDVSKLQMKDVTIKGCYHLSGVDIVDSEITNSHIKDCDIYDTKITDSTIVRCNLFGYADCRDSKFRDCFISRNIELKDCSVCGSLGKMGGTMKGGSLKNTTVLIDMADIHDDVVKNNVNEIQ